MNNFNTLYLAARKGIRVSKLGPGRYRAMHAATRIRAIDKKRPLALQRCAMLVAKQQDETP